MVVALLLAGGMSLLLGGGHYFVTHAVKLSTALNVPPLVIGLTVVAIGTAAPEIITAAVAAWHRYSDVAIGKIIGSSIFNLLGIAGITAMASLIRTPQDF